MKKRSVAIVLALLLGGIGMHRFYLNRSGSGFIYMIFCWTFIPMIISFLEAITFLSYTDEAFNKKYGDPLTQGYIESSKKIENTQNFSATDELLKLSSLLEKGLLTKDEFESKKSVLLKKIG